jgi:hypothetical protein
MADLKISELTNLTAADPVSDMLPIVDVSATPPASGSTKRISINNILSSSPTASGALTVTGLVTAGSATITGDLTVDTSTLKVDSTLDRVGVGITTIPFKFTVANAASVNTMCLVNTASNASRLVFGTNAVPGDSWTQIEGDARSTGYFAIRTNDTERLKVDSTGNINITSGNVVMATSGKGIDFSATANSSGTMTSELLNDYEEGTWVPTDASGAGLTFTVSACRYTKVGRTVTIQGNITYPATASTANATWGGFPFNSSDVFNLRIIYTDASVASLTYISSNTANAFLLTPGLNTQNVTVSGKAIVFSGTYMV